jgi:predicted ABC-type ATPase
VIQAGHDVPKRDISRRLDAGLKNFHGVYKQIVDVRTLYDNSGNMPYVIDQGENQ